MCETLEEHIDADVLFEKRYSERGYSYDLVRAPYGFLTGLQAKQIRSDPGSIYYLDIALLYFNGDCDYRSNERVRSLWNQITRPLQPAPWPVPRLESAKEQSQLCDTLGGGRLRPTTCQPDILRIWLHNCESWHKGCWWTGYKHLIQLRLFNIKFRCVRVFQVSQDDSLRCVALSYVWGSKTHRVTLNKANGNTLNKKGKIELCHLSHTVSDAATVVERLDERYLWVDAFIIQDDPDDLTAQLPAMGHIFARSLLTIVAATSEDAETGLPGVNAQARSVQRVLGPLGGGALLTSCIPKPKEKLRSSKFGKSHYLQNGTPVVGPFKRRFCLANVFFSCKNKFTGNVSAPVGVKKLVSKLALKLGVLGIGNHRT